MKYKISKAQYKALMKKLEQTTITIDNHRKILIYRRREGYANIPKN